MDRIEIFAQFQIFKQEYTRKNEDAKQMDGNKWQQIFLQFLTFERGLLEKNFPISESMQERVTMYMDYTNMNNFFQQVENVFFLPATTTNSTTTSTQQEEEQQQQKSSTIIDVDASDDDSVQQQQQGDDDNENTTEAAQQQPPQQDDEKEADDQASVEQPPAKRLKLFLPAIEVNGVQYLFKKQLQIALAKKAVDIPSRHKLLLIGDEIKAVNNGLKLANVSSHFDFLELERVKGRIALCATEYAKVILKHDKYAMKTMHKFLLQSENKTSMHENTDDEALDVSFDLEDHSKQSSSRDVNSTSSSSEEDDDGDAMLHLSFHRKAKRKRGDYSLLSPLNAIQWGTSIYVVGNDVARAMGVGLFFIFITCFIALYCIIL